MWRHLVCLPNTSLITKPPARIKRPELTTSAIHQLAGNGETPFKPNAACLIPSKPTQTHPEAQLTLNQLTHPPPTHAAL